MAGQFNRRDFLRKSMLASAGAAALGISFEEKALLAQNETPAKPQAMKTARPGLPAGKIGNVEISRLICGGNLVRGGAHARDLMYVSDLLENYFTDEKIFETFEICEQNGINTVIGDTDDKTFRILQKYRDERGGKMQWIAQLYIREDDVTSDAQRAVDMGAVGGFVMGACGDRWVKHKRMDQLAEAVEFIKQNGLIAGIAGHSKFVPMECEKAGIDCDFYFKTIHHDQYWSALPIEQRRPFLVDSFGEDDHDCIWEQYPEETIEFMKTVKKPWIGYKVLAAGAIHPKDGFRYAFENGADFLCVGMFDFQVREDVIIAKRILSDKEVIDRERPWMG